MKKTSGILLLLIVAAGASYFLWERERPLGDMKAAQYLPGDAVALVEITDVPRSAARWKDTALYKISQEPEVVAFLEKPESRIPRTRQRNMLENLLNLHPKEIFIAATGQGADGPKVVGGFDYSGSKSDAAALVADVKSDLKERFPDGKSDIEQYGASEIETFAHQETTIATVFHGRWFFASNDLDLLKSTLDRLDGKMNVATSLRENATYKFCVGKMPQDSDGVVFVQTQGMIDTVATMLSAVPNADPSSLDAYKKIQAVSASMKFEGDKIHDTLYVYKPGGEALPPLALNSMAFTSADTVLYFATAFGLNKAPTLPNPALDKTGILSMLEGLEDSFTQAGLTFDQFKGAFGPEAGLAVNWPQDSVQPTGVFALDVRNKAKAQSFIDMLTNGVGGTGGWRAWPKQEIDGAQFYMMPQAGAGIISLSPVLALTDNALLFGIDLDSVKKAAQDAKAGGARMDKGSDFQAASSLVGKPTDSFGYIDSRALFERIYSVASKALIMVPLFYPSVGDYCDLGKLPHPDTISKHLSPIVYTQSTDENGSMVESVGPVTFTEVLFGVGIGGGAAAVVQMQHNGMPSLAPPTQAPAAPPSAMPGTP